MSMGPRGRGTGGCTGTRARHGGRAGVRGRRRLPLVADGDSAEQIGAPIGEDEAYEQAQQSATNSQGVVA